MTNLPEPPTEPVAVPTDDPVADAVPSTSSTSADGTGATGADLRRGPFRAGDKVQLTDSRGRLSTITLHEDGSFHTHRGYLRHTELIGRSEGTVVTNTGGTEYLALRPLLADYVLSMPRGAAVVYPKDAGQIVAMADIFPGARVVEAGVGSGALTMSLLRAVGDAGLVHSIERREDFAEIAKGNVETFFGGAHPAWRLSIGDLSDVLPGVAGPGSVDRVVLDMLAPWENLDAVADALAPGGVLVAYVATTTQLSRFAEDVRDDGRYSEPTAWETIVRGWHLEGLAVRPEHRMMGHTGFLIMTRRLAEGQAPPLRKRRPSKGAYPVEEAWTEEDLGERVTSDKRVRRARRDVGRPRPGTESQPQGPGRARPGDQPRFEDRTGGPAGSDL